MDCPTSRFNGPELALLAPAAERERSPHRRGPGVTGDQDIQ
jgi:hypothetical protein